MAVIETNKLTKSYKNNRGIIDVDLEVDEGEIFGFIGPNGAGKSTTIRTLLNFIFPTSGSAKILGKDCVKDSEEIKKYVGYVPSEVNYYGEMKSIDIIKYAASFYNKFDAERVNNLCDMFQVELNKRMRELSLGNKKKIAIVQALISQPKLLILDEPANGLDPLIQNRLFEVLQEENKKGMTIFFSSHNLSEVQKFCSKVAIIKEGKIIAVKSIDALLQTSVKYVSIKSKDNITSELQNIGAKNIEHNSSQYLNFVYDKDINILIKLISKFSIQDIQIKEPTLEDAFMSFYKKEE